MSIAIGLPTNGVRERLFALSLSKGFDFSVGLASFDELRIVGLPSTGSGRTGKSSFLRDGTLA